MVKDKKKKKKKKTCLQIDLSVPTDNNISVKEYNKISKKNDLDIEIEKIWHLKTTAMLVIVGARGIIKKGTDKHIIKIPDSPSLYHIQKIALCGTVHLLWKIL